jgi:RNA polymerase sigma factor for flagellar operon FliA
MKSGGTTEKKLPADDAEVLRRVNEGLPLVIKAAIKVRRSLADNLDIDDLQSMGREGLLDAARTYDAERGVPFGAWAYLKIRGAIFDGLRRQADLPRAIYAKIRAFEAASQTREGQIEDESAAASENSEAADARVASTTATLAMAMATAFLAAKKGIDNTHDPLAASPEETAMRSTLLQKVRASIDRLPENQRDLLTRVYFEDLPLDESAKQLGLSKSWGSRLHARALETLARDLKNRKITDE